MIPQNDSKKLKNLILKNLQMTLQPCFILTTNYMNNPKVSLFPEDNDKQKRRDIDVEVNVKAVGSDSSCDAMEEEKEVSQVVAKQANNTNHNAAVNMVYSSGRVRSLSKASHNREGTNTSNGGPSSNNVFMGQRVGSSTNLLNGSS